MLLASHPIERIRGMKVRISKAMGIRGSRDLLGPTPLDERGSKAVKLDYVNTHQERRD